MQPVQPYNHINSSTKTPHYDSHWRKAVQVQQVRLFLNYFKLYEDSQKHLLQRNNQSFRKTLFQYLSLHYWLRGDMGKKDAKNWQK